MLKDRWKIMFFEFLTCTCGILFMKEHKHNEESISFLHFWVFLLHNGQVSMHKLPDLPHPVCTSSGAGERRWHIAALPACVLSASKAEICFLAAHI